MEQALVDAGLGIEEDARVGADDEDVVGYIRVRLVGDDEMESFLLVRPGLSDEQREEVAGWFVGLVERFATGRSDDDGWFPMSEGGWVHMHARRHLFPEWD